ncbi:MAG: O-antigen ligase family protein [bacterium]
MINYLEKAIKVILASSLVIISLYFDKNIVGIYDISKASGLWVFAFIILSLWISLIVLKGKCEFFKNPLNLPILLWLLVNITSTITSDAPIISLFGFYKRYDGLLTQISYIIIALSFIHLCDISYLKKIITLIAIVGIISGIYAVFQYYGMDFFFPERTGGGRVISFMGNPIFAATYLIMSFFITLSLYFYYKGITSWFFLIASSIIYISSFMAQSRGPFLGFIFSYLVFVIIFLFLRKMDKKFLISLIIIAIITIFSNFSLNSIIGRFFGEVSKAANAQIEIKGSAGVRLAIWRDVLRNVLKKPLFGTGPDTMPISYPKYRTLDTVKKVGVYATAESTHNEFLDILATRGILGLLAYLWILLVFVILSIKALLTFQDKWLIAGIGLSWLSYIASNQFAFGVHPTSLLFWVLTGSIAIFYKPKQQKKPISLKIPQSKIFFVFLISIITMIFLFFLSKPYRADMLYRVVYDIRDKKPLEDVIKAAEDVLRVYPYDVQYLQELNSLYLSAAQQGKDTKIWISKTMDIAKKLIFVNPNSDIGYTVLAISYYLEGGSMDKVIENYKKAIELNPYSVDSHCNLAQTYQREGMFKEAKIEYKKALEADPECERAISGLKSLGEKPF